MGSLVFIGIWGYLFLQLQKAKLPLLWCAGISLGLAWWLFSILMNIFEGLWLTLHQPIFSTLLVVGLLSSGVCASAVVYLRHYYMKLKDPFKHLR